MQTGNFCWYELATTDPEAAKKFYGNLFGWTFDDNPMPGEHAGTYTMIKVDGRSIAGLFKLEGPMFEGVPPNWGSYVDTDDVDATAAKAGDLGGEVMGKPMDVEGIGRMAFLKGPEGANISCFQWADQPDGETADKSKEGVFCWSELLSDDVEKSQAFYTKLFNWGSEPMGGDGHYSLFKAGEDWVGGLMAKPAEMGRAPSFWSHYITVQDCEAKTKQAAEMGATVLVSNMEVPKMGRFSTFQDPQGATISVWQAANKE